MLQRETLKFLADLKDNNNKEWFAEHRSRYDSARIDFRDFVDDLISEIIEFDGDLVGIEAKKSVFRLFRDVRFSKNKDPYKLNFGASICRDGRKSPYAGYYVHVMPGNSFIGGGHYRPEAPELKKIRAFIEANASELREITSGKQFKSYFGDLRGDRLKSAPKGYPKDHPDIDLLRMKGFFVLHEVTDDELCQEGFTEKAAAKLEIMHPLIQFLNDAVSQ